MQTRAKRENCRIRKGPAPCFSSSVVNVTLCLRNKSILYTQLQQQQCTLFSLLQSQYFSVSVVPRLLSLRTRRASERFCTCVSFAISPPPLSSRKRTLAHINGVATSHKHMHNLNLVLIVFIVFG